MSDTSSVVYDVDDEYDITKDLETLYAIRESHIGALTRLLAAINNDGVFEALGKGQLCVRRRHIQTNFEAHM